MDFLHHFTDYFAQIPGHWHELINNFPKYLPIIGMLIVIESLLSIDNAAVLATMVTALPKDQREKALKYGIFGAYFFRGVCLILAGFLVSFWWLKPLGGLYLLYIVYDWWKSKQTETTEDDFDQVDVQGNWFYRATVGVIGTFWATVGLVEIMDLTFSIDNVLAVVAYTDNTVVIIIGVFIGILAMRFVAQAFVHLMEKYTFLETSAFVVIFVLGIKLCLSGLEGIHGNASIDAFNETMKGHTVDWIFSGLTIAIFALPMLTSFLFNFPKKNEEVEA
jgi:YkoY family integral membrane protein